MALQAGLTVPLSKAKTPVALAGVSERPAGFVRSSAGGIHRGPSRPSVNGSSASPQVSRVPVRDVRGHVQTSKNTEIVKEGWWLRDTADNMVDITSLRQLTAELEGARDRLVIVDFYAHFCNSCRALYPKLCKLARANPDILFLKVNWMDNKALCKSLGIKALPYFHFYRGAEGRVEAFSASITKFKRLKDAIALHSTPRCSLGPSLSCNELFNVPEGKPLTPADIARKKISKQFADSPPSPREPLAGAPL